MKKIIYLILIITLQSSISGITMAATPSVTADQQACIKAAQDKRSAAIKTAQNTLDSITGDALKSKQSAITVAQDTLKVAVKDASQIRTKAIQAAENIKDERAKAKAIQAAQDAYNNNATVKRAVITYEAATKAAVNKYNNDATVKNGKPPYAVAVKAADDQFKIDQKACLEAAHKGFFTTIGSAISDFFSKIIKFFSGKK